MAARYCTVSFFFRNTVTGHEEFVHLGALRDSATQAVVQYPGMFTASVPDPAVTGIDPKLYGYLKVHPGGPGE